MAESSTRPGWWGNGKASRRLVCLGAGLGAVGAVVHLLSYTLPYFNPVFISFYLFYLVVEVLVTAILGLVVAGVVISARFLVTEAGSRKTLTVVTGFSALMSSGILAYAFCSLFPPLTNPGAIAAVIGVLVGSVFAIVSHRHTSET
ncbi:hypothetical protein ACIPY0_07330 [Paenarthrobacter nicotinovorans]|uniref:hypothetical protein n=1 Tax=Paenarthrobacter nicotinovorans TaxID=29320 RepID=UPI003809359E